MKKVYIILYVMVLILLCSSVSAVTLILNLSDSDNLEDTYIRSDDAGTNFGSEPEFILGNASGTSHTNMFIKFNLSSIPIGSTITFARLYLYLTLNRLDEAEEHINVTLHQIYDTSWEEDVITWGSPPAAGMNDTPESQVQFNPTNQKGRYNWTIIGMVNNVTNGLNRNLSMRLITDGNTDDLLLDAIFFSSKEASNTSNRPYLD